MLSAPDKDHTMIIDCHIHLFQSKVASDRSRFIHADPSFGALYSSPKSRIATPSQIIDYMDECSVNKAVVFGFPWTNSELYIENNETVLEFGSKYPDRIIPFATFALNDPEKACAEAQRTLQNGFMGLGELSMYENGWNQTALNTLRECAGFASHFKKPVMIHVNEPVGHHYPGKINTDFDALLKVIGQFPDVDFVLAHFGGGIFFYALMPEIRALLSRTYVDTAASPYIYDSRIYDVAVQIMGENNIVFGSDYPLLRYERYARDIDTSSLTLSQKERILGSNAKKLFNL